MLIWFIVQVADFAVHSCAVKVLHICAMQLMQCGFSVLLNLLLLPSFPCSLFPGGFDIHLSEQ